MILAAIVAALPAVALAQDDPVQAPKREINRIGDQPVEREAELELTAPKPDPATLPKVETPEARAAREAAERQQRVRSSLADARRALAEGRIDQPGDDCAWQHFRRVLDIEPENAEALAGRSRGVYVEAGRTHLYDERSPRVLVGQGHTAYLKIAEGCDRRCAFCAIPAIRGRQRSRTVASLLQEAAALLVAAATMIACQPQKCSRLRTSLNIRALSNRWVE